MAEFWLATFDLDSVAASGPTAAAPLGPKDVASGWAIEILRDGDKYAVLLSDVDDVPAPMRLRCQIGFANEHQSCSVWSGRGFPIADAIIDNQSENTLRVRCACFLDTDAIDYDAEVISISNMIIDDSGRCASVAAKYEQKLQVPDYAFPATLIKQRQVAWSPVRSNVHAVNPTPLRLKVASPRFPSLPPFKSGTITPKAFWHGDVEVPEWPPHFPNVAESSASRLNEFGPPAFAFEDVEVLGFRLNLDELGVLDGRPSAEVDDLLAKMIDRLNFHLDPLVPKEIGKSQVRDAIPDFRYRPATRTVILELLRYGKMKEKAPPPPLRTEDYQSQHELLVRILVGRVDDDATQARDPATYVPAIFVDNPWSKLLGHTVGLDKWMAEFRTSDGTLRPDGRQSADGEPKELASIKEIRLATQAGGTLGKTLLKLDCEYQSITNWTAFASVDLDSAFGMSALGQVRWRQDDFNDVEFRRSFARSAVRATTTSFNSIQVSPVGEKRLLEQWENETTLIRGTFSVKDKVEFVMPNGVVTVTLCAEPSAPQGWKDFCRLLGIDKDKRNISLTTGNWYRMRTSMDLTIQNSFE